MARAKAAPKSSPKAKALATRASQAKRRSSKALAALNPDRPIFDQLEEAEAAASKAPRDRARTLSSTVAKQLRDNFNKITPAQATA